MRPSAGIGHAGDRGRIPGQLGREVEGQRAVLTRLRLGATLEIPIEAARRDLTLRPGLRTVATDEDGGLNGETGVGAAGRIDFGVDYRLEGNISQEFGGFYSGLGRRLCRRNRVSYGAGVGLRMDFLRHAAQPPETKGMAVPAHRASAVMPNSADREALHIRGANPECCVVGCVSQ